jgi:uncharacterized protein (TIGR01777 family)
MAAGAFSRLVPAWESVRLQGADEGIWEGLERKLWVSPLRLPWRALHEGFVQDEQFFDRQVQGPFAAWNHRHNFTQGLLDEIDFELPLRPFSRLALPALRAQMGWMFLHRHRTTAFDLRFPSAPKLKIGVTGSSGLVGRHLVAFLRAQGHQVTCAVRRNPAGSQAGPWACQDFEGLDALVHLAGKGVMDGDFGRAHRAEIERSRVWATQQLVAGLLQLKHPPGVVVCASGSGYYGNVAGVCDEDRAPGDDFLARVCQAWEAALGPLAANGVRSVSLRIAPVLHLAGGMLPILYWSSRLGCSGRFGDGQQPLSWIMLDDLLGLIYQSIVRPDWRGPINAAAPELSFLGQLAKRVAPWAPQVSLPVDWLKRLAGARSELLLSGNHLSCAKVRQLGYEFAYPSLEGALRHALGRYTREDYPPGWNFQLFTS